MNFDFTTINWWVIGAAGLALLAWLAVRYGPTVWGWLKPAPPTPGPAADLYPHVLALKAVLSAELFNLVLTEVCGKTVPKPAVLWNVTTNMGVLDKEATPCSTS